MSPAITATFRSLQHRNFRLFAAGQVVSLTGTWAQRIAQDWLVLSLSHNSGVALGITTGLQFLPVLLFGLWGGVLADRYDKRKILIGVLAAMGLLALLLAVLDLTGVVRLWQVYALAFALGLTSAVETPVRQAFVSEIVPPADLGNAVGLNSAIFNSARIVGPALAGLVIATAGTGWVFLGNAVSFGFVLAGLLAMRVADLHPAKRLVKAKGQVREGLAYVRARPDLLVPIVLVAVVGTFGLNFQITLALVAKQTFGLGAGAFGLLTSALAAGSLIGALRSAGRSTRPPARLLFGSALAFGVLEILVGLAPTFWVMAVLLVPTGLAVLTFSTTANAMVQLGTEPALRGRVMALYVLVFLGGTPLGAPIIGWLAETMGPRFGLIAGGAICALAALGCALWLARSKRVTVRPHLVARRPHLHIKPKAG